MRQDEFMHMLQNEGFPDPVLVAQPAQGGLETHEHDFEVKARVVKGSIAITIDHQTTTYQVGDVFHLPYRQPHCERYGVEGVTYWASRKT